MSMPSEPFASQEAAQFWRYIASTLDRLIALVAEQPEAVVRFRPPLPDTNSILGLAHHTLANASANILGAAAGRAAARDRQSEFDDLDAKDLLQLWASVRTELEDVLRSADAPWLDGKVEHSWRGRLARREVLIIVARHAAEHLGQAELTRDLAIASLRP